MEYLDFVLLIDQGRKGLYTLHLVESPGGEAHGPLDLDVASPEIRQLLAAVRQEPSSSATAIELGRALFGALLKTAEVYACYHTSLLRARDRGRGLRIRLRCQPAELSALPWELLFDSGLKRDFLCLSRETPVVRHLDLALPIEPLQLPPPIRILGMVGFSEGLDAAREQQLMSAAIEHLAERGIVELVWVEGSGWRELKEALRRGPWHVFHFIGHGEFDPTSGEAGEGFVLLDTAPPGRRPRAQPFPARDLAVLLADTAALKLAVINACKGGMAGDRDLLSSLGAVLASRGIPAVLSMQQAISDRAALELSRTFYDRLANGEPVDTALADARKGIKLALGETVEWATPVLHLRARDGRILCIDYAKALFTASDGTRESGEARGVSLPEQDTRRGLDILRRKVWSSWIEGVLARSISRSIPLELGKEALAGAVDSPWGSILEAPGSLGQVFTEVGGSLLLLGEPGSGKTVALLELARDLLRASERDPDRPVPVVFPLSSWAVERLPLLAWMTDELAAKYFIPKRIGHLWLDRGHVLPLLDGLDEMPEAAQAGCVEAINAYLDRSTSTGLAVCCRLKEYLALPFRLRLNGALRLLPLSEDQVWVYVKAGGERLAALGLLLEKDSGLRLEARSPLMLGLMTRTYEGLSPDEIVRADPRSLAARRRALMEAYVQRMYHRAGLRRADA